MKTKLMLMSKTDIKNFKPTESMLKSAEAVFLNMAIVEEIREIVKGYQRKVLMRHEFISTREWQDHKKIYDPDRSYLLTDSDFKTYLAECREEQEKAGLKTKSPEYCPLLVAEDHLREAENLLMDSFEELTGLKARDINMKLDTRKKFLDLTLKYMSKFMDTKRILEKVAIK